jgi:hypothetical protein
MERVGCSYATAGHSGTSLLRRGWNQAERGCIWGVFDEVYSAMIGRRNLDTPTGITGVTGGMEARPPHREVISAI